MAAGTPYLPEWVKLPDLGRPLRLAVCGGDYRARIDVDEPFDAALALRPIATLVVNAGPTLQNLLIAWAGERGVAVEMQADLLAAGCDALVAFRGAEAMRLVGLAQEAGLPVWSPWGHPDPGPLNAKPSWASRPFRLRR